MAEEEDVELTLPNKYIRNTSACGTFLTENQLEADQTSSIQSQLQERSPHNSVEQQQQNSNWSDRCPWEGSMQKRRSVQLDTTLGRGQTDSQSECPRPGVLHIGDKPPCLLGNPETGRMVGKASTLLTGVGTFWFANNQYEKAPSWITAWLW